MHDRLVAAKHTIYGQNVERAVCKATTEEIIGPKKKHLDCKFLFVSQKATPFEFNLFVYFFCAMS